MSMVFNRSLFYRNNRPVPVVRGDTLIHGGNECESKSHLQESYLFFSSYSKQKKHSFGVSAPELVDVESNRNK